MSSPSPKKRILILGGGFGGVYTFLRLHKTYHRSRQVEIQIVNKENYFLFTPLLHEVATGGISEDNIVYNLRTLFGCCLAGFTRGQVQHIDLDKKTVRTSAGEINYDVLVYALGADTNFFGLDADSQRNTLTLKSLNEAREMKNAALSAFEQSKKRSFVIVGGGPTGVELAAELQEFLNDLTAVFPPAPHDPAMLYVIQAADRLIPQFSPPLSKKALAALRQKGVEVILNEVITKVDPDKVTLRSGREILSSVTIWTAGVKANRVEFTPPVERNSKDQLTINEFLALPGHPEVFVAGDAAAVPGVPMTAQAAVEAGTIVAENIIAHLANQPLGKFHYHHRGDLFSLGQWMAGAEISGVRFFGHFAWWLWRTVYLSKLVGVRNKIKVALDWTMDIFLPRDLNHY